MRMQTISHKTAFAEDQPQKTVWLKTSVVAAV
jgi:hypothetical protein